METLMATGSLLLATAMILIVNGLSTIEYYKNMPQWFADPPASFEILRQQTQKAQKRWIPIQLLFIASFITALITNWNLDTVRPYLITAGIAFLIIIISTAVYYAPEVIAFSKTPVDAPKTDKLLKRVSKWYRSSVVRNVFQLIVLILILIATYNYFTL